MASPGTFILAETGLRQNVSPEVIVQSEILALNAEELLARVQEELDENPALELTDDAISCRMPLRQPDALPLATDGLENLGGPYTLVDDLRLQLATVSGVRRAICEHLVDCLDERGFLDIACTEVAEQFGVSPFEVEAAVQLLQSLEPAGVGARTLRECLLLQVRRFDPSDVPAATEAFINTCLSTAHKQSAAQAASALRLTDEDLAAILQFIGARLYMWPADQFRDQEPGAAEASRTVVPDALISARDGFLRVMVTQSWSRSLRVSEAYERLDGEWQRANSAVSLAERERLAEKVREARAFIHHLTRREAVLRRVTEAVIKRQQAYFTDGPAGLRPLARKDIAAALGMHESTISRVTRDKYVQLPDERLVSFDFFFDASVSAKAELRDLIADEDPSHPLSDADLAAVLEERGFALARRTVAKYRDALGLPPAHARRQRHPRLPLRATA